MEVDPGELIDHGAEVGANNGFKRSEHWPAVEKAFLQQHPTCVVCGRADLPRNVHHTDAPFHFARYLGRPDLELDPRNLHTLCVAHDNEHHVLVGHFDDYESFNPDLLAWVKKTKTMDAATIRALAEWQEAVKTRPPFLSKMTQQQKIEMRKHLDALFPPDPNVLNKFPDAKPTPFPPPGK
jgi:hypothetical protein